MPWNPNIPPDVRTVHLGEFTHEHVATLGKAFDAERIAWWTKEPGYLSRIWQRGVEVFVDGARMDEARAIADAILSTNP